MEPTIEAKCSVCRDAIEVPVFVAEFMKKWSVFPGKMACEGCRKESKSPAPKDDRSQDWY
jgi:hypothetical protein